MAVSRKRLVLDWQVPDFAGEVRIDAAAYLRAMERINPDTVILMAKSAFGWTYYDEAEPHHNPALKQDLFADLVAPLQGRGIHVHAYFNITLNDVVGAERPEWHQVAPDGRPVTLKYGYHQLCMNSPYREYLLAMMTRFVEQYPVEGLWFDITYFHQTGCFCACCREQFQAETGLGLTPEIAADPQANLRFHQFRRDSRRRFIEDAVERARRVRPGLEFSFNHAGDMAFAQPEADRAADVLGREFHPPRFAQGGMDARYMRTLGKPFDLILPESLDSWGDWTVMRPATLRTMLAICAAHGAQAMIGHVVYPSYDFAGQMAEGVVQTLADGFAYMDRRRAFYDGAVSAPVGACLFSVESFRAVQAREGLGYIPSEYRSLQGAAALLADSNVHFDILCEETLDRLAEYEFLVMAEVEHVSEKTAAIIREYVRNGGVLLAMGATGLADECGRPLPRFELGDLFGVEWVEEEPYSVTYLDRMAPRVAKGLPEMPLLLKAAGAQELTAKRRSLRCRALPGAKVWATFAEPSLEPDVAAHRHIYHMHSPPARRTDWAAIVHTRCGEGQVIYVAGPLSQVYSYSSSPWLRRLFINLLRAAGVPRRLDVDGPAGLETVLMQQGERWVLHLVPRITEKADSAQVAEGVCVRGVKVKLRLPDAQTVTLKPSGKPIRCRRTKDGLTFRVPPFADWTIITIDKQDR